MNYRNIQSVEQLRSEYHLPAPINESKIEEKKGDGKADDFISIGLDLFKALQEVLRGGLGGFGELLRPSEQLVESVSVQIDTVLVVPAVDGHGHRNQKVVNGICPGTIRSRIHQYFNHRFSPFP